MATPRCLYCGRKLPNANTTTCPYCGIALKREDAEEPEKQKKKLTEEEMLEQVRTHLEELENHKVEPNRWTIIGSALVLILVVVAMLTEGFGIFRHVTTNPIGVYRDAAANFLSASSGSYETELTILETDEKGVVIPGTEYTEYRRGDYKFGGKSSAGFEFNERVTDSNGSEQTRFVSNGEGNITEDPLIGIILPLLETDFTNSGGTVMYSTGTWQSVLKDGKYDTEGLTNRLKTLLAERAALSGLNFGGEALDLFFEITAKFFDKTLDSRVAFDGAFKHYSRVTAGGISTYEFDFSLDGLIETYTGNLKGAGSALKWRPMRAEFDRWAGGINPEYFANDGIDMFFGELQPLADYLRDIHCIIVIDRDRNLQRLEFTNSDPFGALRFSYKLTVPAA